MLDGQLVVERLSKRFGGVVVAQEVNLQLLPGELRALIGPNGAGKSTLVNMISGFVRHDHGTVRLDGVDIGNWPPHKRRAAGMARTFQTSRLFPQTTALRHVLIALRFRHPSIKLMSLTRIGRNEETLAWQALETVGIRELAYTNAGELSHGKRRLLEIAMAIVERPTVLLLDEPTAGMSVKETEEVADILEGLTDVCSVLVIDHDMTFIRRLEAPVTVLHRGAVVREGTIEELEKDEYVREIYLGVPDVV